jgi:hypothetical protein
MRFIVRIQPRPMGVGWNEWLGRTLGIAGHAMSDPFREAGNNDDGDMRTRRQ